MSTIFNYRKALTYPSYAQNISSDKNEPMVAFDLYKIYNEDQRYGVAYNKHDWIMSINPEYHLLIECEWDDIDFLSTDETTYIIAIKDNCQTYFNIGAETILIEISKNHWGFDLNLIALDVSNHFTIENNSKRDHPPHITDYLPEPVEKLKTQLYAQCQLVGKYDEGDVYEMTVAEFYRWTTKIKACLVFYSTKNNDISQTPFYESN